jgi:DNA-binding CsgD family transcriptional regulator
MPVESPPAAWHWGQFRADATRYAPRIAWDLLTDAQADCLYLNDYSETTLSQRAIAIVYHVSPPTVNIHVRHARAALRRAGREHAYHDVPEPPAGGNRVACVECDTPWQDCTTCIARLFFGGGDHAIFRGTKQGRRRLLREEEIAAGEMDTAVNLKTQGHRRADADWQLQKNHLTRESDEEDEGGG